MVHIFLYLINQKKSITGTQVAYIKFIMGSGSYILTPGRKVGDSNLLNISDDFRNSAFLKIIMK